MLQRGSRVTSAPFSCVKHAVMIQNEKIEVESKVGDGTENLMLFGMSGKRKQSSVFFEAD